MTISGTTEKKADPRFDLASYSYESTEGLVNLTGYRNQNENRDPRILKQFPWEIEAPQVASAYMDLESLGNTVCAKERSQQLVHGLISSSCAITQVVTTVNLSLRAESSTVKKKQEKNFEPQISESFEAPRDEIFEDGVEGRFSRDLITLIRSFGNKERSEQLVHGVISSSWAITQIATTVNPGLWAESTTAKKEQEKKFELKIFDSFEAAKDEIFEDGVESRFSKDLVKLIKLFGNDAVTVVTDLIISGYANHEVASEALRWIGRMNHPQSYSNRLWLLESCLNNASSKIRDGAILGLASMDDPNAIPYIKNAMRRERIIELRDDMKQVIDQLENTIGGIHITAGKEK